MNIVFNHINVHWYGLTFNTNVQTPLNLNILLIQLMISVLCSIFSPLNPRSSRSWDHINWVVCEQRVNFLDCVIVFKLRIFLSIVLLFMLSPFVVTPSSTFPLHIYHWYHPSVPYLFTLSSVVSNSLTCDRRSYIIVLETERYTYWM